MIDLKDLYDELAEVYPTAYWSFPVGQNVTPPYIVYFENGTDNFGADNKTYHIRREISVELYTRHKDPDAEEAVEAVFDALELFWDKTEAFLDDENVYEVIYSLEV